MILKEQIRLRNQINEIQKRTPLALAKLWVPHCHRFDGLGLNSPRERGCGKPMTRLSGKTWHCSTCDITEQRTSQSDPYLKMGTEATAIFGGNRSGKTYGAAQYCVAMAAGAKCWWVREWIKNNNLPEDLIPYQSNKVVVSALSYADALAYVRPALEQFLPAGSRFKKWKAQDRASVHLPDGGSITSYSADSGPAKYQGISAKLIWLDEEGPESVFSECLMRIVDTKGKIIMTMTPLKGLTWPHEKFIINPPSPTSFVYHKIHGLDNPWVSSVKMRRAIKHLSLESQESRLYGHFRNQTGLVYHEFDQNIHVVKPFSIPEHFIRYRCIDFGVVHPFVCLVVVENPDDNSLFVVAEYFKTEQTTIYNGNAVNKLFSKYEPFEFTVCDSASKDARMLIARHCGIPNKPAPKHIGVINTINLVKELLCPDAEGKPRLYVFNTCKELLKEFRLYSWKTNRVGKDEVRKEFDHGLDALRYLVAFLYRLRRHI